MATTDFTDEMEHDGIVYSTDRSRLDLPFVYNYLNISYWAKGVPQSIFQRSVENSICIGMYKGGKQVGFARLITDQATFAWLADVFVDEAFKGQGISKRMMQFIMSFDFVPTLRRFMLATRDAHGLYEKSGFQVPENPDRLMEVLQADIYSRIEHL